MRSMCPRQAGVPFISDGLPSSSRMWHLPHGSRPASVASQHGLGSRLCSLHRAAACCTASGTFWDRSSTADLFQRPEGMRPLCSRRGMLALQPQRRSGKTSQPAAAMEVSDIDLSQAQDEELQELAQYWGYTQIGRPLPEGATIDILAQAVPEELYQPKPEVSLGHILVSSGIMAAGFWVQHFWHSILPLHLQLASWLLIGVGYFGLFVLAYEAAMFRLLPETPILQDVIGTLLMTPSLYAFESVRLKSFAHMLAPNMLGQDVQAAWHPVTVGQVQDMGPVQLAALRLLWGTPLKLLASIGHWLRSWDGFDLKRYTPLSRGAMLLSWAIPAVFVGSVFPAVIGAGGLGTLVNAWLMPWLVFHCCLSTLTLVRHTAPHIPFQPAGLQYDEGQAALNGTVTLLLPGWLHYVLHGFNYAAVQQVAGSVPFYHMRQAHEALRQRLGPHLTEARPCLELLRNLIYQWQVYDEQRETYVTIDEAVARAGRQQRGGGAGNETYNGGSGPSGSAVSAAGSLEPVADSVREAWAKMVLQMKK